MEKATHNRISKLLVLKTIVYSLSAQCWFLAAGSFVAEQKWADKILSWIHIKMVAIESVGNKVHHCPFCGMSRAFKSIWLGQFEKAIEYNQISILVFSAVIIGCLSGIALLANDLIKSCPANHNRKIL